MERLCCAAHGGCLLLYHNYPTWKYDFKLKMSTFPLIRCGVYAVFLVLFSPKGQKGRQSPQTMVTGTAACARSRTARRRSSASCVTSGKGRQPGKKSRGQRAVTSTTTHASNAHRQLNVQSQSRSLLSGSAAPNPSSGFILTGSG